MKTQQFNTTRHMKAQSITAIFLAAIILVACGPQGDPLDAKKAELDGAKATLAELRQTISQLEGEISAEDPDYFKASNSTIPVTSMPASKTHFEHKIEVRGSVMSRTNVQVGAEMGGKLNRVAVKEGDAVRKGQTLAVFDTEDIQRSIDALTTQLSFANTVFEKRERLWKKNIGTEIQYLEAKTNKESLEKQLATLNTQMKKTVVKAPFSGTIEKLPVKVGQVLQAGSPVALLVGNSDMYITTEVSENFVSAFRKGDKVRATIPSLGESFETEISSIGQVINQASRTFTLEVKLPANANYKTNQIVVLQLTDYVNEEAVVIPSRIIQEDIDGNFVYLIDNNKAKKVHIELGLSYENLTQVVAGLSGGETVVDKGNRAVGDGSIVDVQN